ncbi:unnamed protein product, partial [Brenthis ino]
MYPSDRHIFGFHKIRLHYLSRTNKQSTFNDTTKTNTPPPSRLVPVGDFDQSLPAQLTRKNNTSIKTKPKSKLYIATLNCLTLRTEERLTELELALSNIKWDVLGLSEVRRLGESIEDRKEYILYYKGETKGNYGVGFMIKKHLERNIEEFKGISDRIAVLNLNLPSYKNKWSIIQIYAPTEQYEESAKDLFYEQLTSVLQQSHKNLMLIGDFNGRIGSQQTGEENAIGKFGFGRRSNNGKRMINMALENNIAFMNSFFNKNTKKKWTWLSPDGSYRNEIDYIATNNRKAFYDVSVIKQLNFNTNHRMVRATIIGSEPKKARNKFNTIKNLSRHLNETKNEIDENYEKGINEIYGPLYTQLAKPKTSNTENETKTLIEERRQLLNNKKDKNNLRAITEVSKKISKSINKDRAKRRLDVLNTHIKKTGGVKKALKELVESKQWITNIKNKAGKQETMRRTMIQIATDFYRTLYAAEPNAQNPTTILEDDEIDDIPVFMQSEIKKAVDSLKSDKSPGRDQITNEMIKTSINTPENLRKLTEIYNTILRTESIPSQWKKSTIILLHKKGDRDNIENYRPISLLSNIYKVFSKLILNRLTRIMDEQQPIEQAGFRAGFSTIDHIH